MIQVCECCKKEYSKKFVSRFCSRKCAYLYKHIEGYKKFLEEDNLYCKGNYTPKNFKDFFMEEQNYKCAICGCENTHNQRPLIFILDHIDGDASNNRRSNLRMICPNCDSQLDTYKSKNKNNKRRNYWKEKIIRSIKEG